MWPYVAYLAVVVKGRFVAHVMWPPEQLYRRLPNGSPWDRGHCCTYPQAILQYWVFACTNSLHTLPHTPIHTYGTFYPHKHTLLNRAVVVLIKWSACLPSYDDPSSNPTAVYSFNSLNYLNERKFKNPFGITYAHKQIFMTNQAHIDLLPSR